MVLSHNLEELPKRTLQIMSALGCAYPISELIVLPCERQPDTLANTSLQF